MENLKDRAVTLYGTYLRIGSNYYIELEDFEDTPLTLKAFETYKKTFGPIEFYASGNARVDMRSALRGHTIQGNLVLSTSEGKYVVSKNIKRWRPVSEYFSNHSTILLQTIRAQHKDVAIGGRVPYVVDLKFLDGSEAVIPMRRDDFQLVRFREWQLTKDALETAQTLRTFLGKQKDAGILRCERFEVYDIESWRAKSRSFYDEHPYEAQSVGFFRHLFIGRYRTWKDHRWIREENRRLNAQPTDNVQEIASVTFSDKPEHNDPPSGG